MLILIILLIFLSFVDCSDNPKVQCSTTKGDLLIEIYPEWAPLGASRFLELVQDQFYTNIAFFRCVKHFLTQFGITEDITKKHWHNNQIKDDPNLHLGIKQNYLSFAGGGPNTRSTQLFIAFEDLDFLGNEPWETPFGVVIEGQDTLDNLYKGYGDIPPFGKGPDQQEIHRKGNHYIKTLFPRIDFLLSCNIIEKREEEIILIDSKEDNKENNFAIDNNESEESNPNKINNPQLRSADNELISSTVIEIIDNNNNRNEALIFKSMFLLLVVLVMGYLYFRYGKVSIANKTL